MKISFYSAGAVVNPRMEHFAMRVLLMISPLYVGCGLLSEAAGVASSKIWNVPDEALRNFLSEILANAINNKCFHDRGRVTVEFHDDLAYIRCQPSFPVDWFTIELEAGEIEIISTIVGVMGA